MTGQKIAKPLDIMLGTIQDDEKTTALEYVQKLGSRLGACFEEVCVQLMKYRGKQRKCFNLSIYGEEYKPEDLVYLREKTRWKQVCHKLVPKWRGPYMVVRRFGSVCNLNSIKSVHLANPLD